MFRQQLTLAKLRAFVTPTMETLGVLVGSLLTVWLASRVLSHELSMSTFATLGVALSMLFDPLRKLSDVWVRVQRSTAGAERIFAVIDQPIESDLSEANVTLAPLANDIVYDRVTFTYPGAETAALESIELTIGKGEAIAVVGPNGSGKTTLVNMLPRFFDPDAGEIRYDGLDLRKATLRSLRDQISLVSQEAVVFAGTPLENIVYGVVDPDESRAVDAAKRAYADEFIRNIPGGYGAVLGERGTTLSGGQRQRLAIARAIFRDAPILIFDEATSQIDTESEQKIQAVLREFAHGRTTLIIAHRMSTIQFADRIIVMDAGRIIDTGPHQELFERCTLYRTLCETQFVTEGA
jgi:subfamily B ATP-binding cassette protein MsbA